MDSSGNVYVTRHNLWKFQPRSRLLEDRFRDVRKSDSVQSGLECGERLLGHGVRCSRLQRKSWSCHGIRAGVFQLFCSLLYWKTPTSAPVVMNLPGSYTLAYWPPLTRLAFDASNNLIFAGQVGNTWVGSVVGSNLQDGVAVSWQNATPTLLPMGSNTWGIANAVIVGP